MTLKFTETSLAGVILIEPTVFEDDRGYFMETFHSEKYAEMGILKPFIQDNHSHSRRGTLRGLHYQLENPQGKLVYAVRGEIFDVAVDIRTGSPDFGKWTGNLLSQKNKHQLYVPEGFAHGFCVLSETADVIYKCTDHYAPGDEYGVFWADNTINIKWPMEGPILSKKDSENPALADIDDSHLPLHEV
ncbi:MAG: dTDP-4-dehydrorhamnose 3,5-epimerase [Deltaproteobacteria bacterium]|jgi:dTDP-4-dehydrorhamnose 3,5-epimerase|nr:dTDP-4-dehydrorhamnose 3,5-epimerase [Deltaproteobacteria bacterium]